MKSSWWATPTSGIERVLFEAAWENERTINVFRLVFGLVMGVPSVASMVVVQGTWWGPAWSILGWGLVAVALIFVLRRRYHRSWSFFLSTADATVWMGGLFLFFQTVPPGPEARHILVDIGLIGFFVTGINVARFSAAVAAWTTVYAFGLYVALASSQIGFSPSYPFEGIQLFLFGGLLVLVSRKLRQVLVRVKERDAFARFLPAPAVERLAKDPSQLKLSGENQDATVLFSDIRGFTALSVAMRPEQVVALLNEYFEEMVAELFQWEGTLDKFIGDGLVAVFAPPLSKQDQATRAIRCALGMVARLEALNAKRIARGDVPLKIGIGLHSGPVVAGSIGSAQRLEYTHIGDTMNTCSRIEGQTKELGEAVLASESTVERADAAAFGARPMGEIPLRGRPEPLKLFAIDRPQGTARPAGAFERA